MSGQIGEKLADERARVECRPFLLLANPQRLPPQMAKLAPAVVSCAVCPPVLTGSGGNGSRKSASGHGDKAFSTESLGVDDECQFRGICDLN